ncbi:MAG: hypothetical protein A3B78_01695 [Omnitrophica WOR_2 bacterium RIFCSPHIGHO2_02_FULL_67_20]|nr:MAG: hypothetical protein A3B78_01695 [Omnitrophica WOR_2 bacterium RIFCSPHIGHO2_02_FULL_67_20]
MVQRLIKFDGEGTLRAFCDLVVGDFVVIKGLRVVNGRKGLFVSMPRQQGKDTKWYDVVEPLTKEVKQEVDQLVLSAYEQTTQD